jgi:hypothetical protein
VLQFDPYTQRWVWEVSISSPLSGRPGYRWGYSSSWQVGQYDALRTLAELLTPAEQLTYLAPTYLGSLFDASLAPGEAL